MTDTIVRASVIIPAFNEEENIQRTIEAIKASNYLEIIVVDNGSTDSTIAKAEALAVAVVEMPVGTIAALRNRGVCESNSNILIFLDADVSVSKQWHEHLPSTINTLNQSRLQVTGSRVRPPDTRNFVSRYWYAPLASSPANYINSGHLITTRELFEEIEGFSEDLVTAEDYDFCVKARKVGAKIVSDSNLVVTHEGFPTSLRGFINRERWHGRQDVHTWRSFVQSRVAWVAGLNLLLLLAAVITSLSGILAAIPVYFLVMYSLSLVLTLLKFGTKPMKYVLIMPILFYFYLCGRSLSIIDRLLDRSK